MSRELDGKLVLLVEDQPYTLVALTLLLQGAGAVVEGVSTLREALELLREAFHRSSPPDAIVCDLLLTDGNALSLPAKLRTLDPDWHGPLVAISAHPEIDKAARQAGFDDFLPKLVSSILPIALAQLFRAKRWGGVPTGS